MLTIWEMSKRYIVGALTAAIFMALGLIGIDAVANPESLEVVENLAEAFGYMVFYVVTVLVTRWRQKKVVESGGVVAERIESASTARDHGVPVKPAPLGRPV